MRRLIAATCSAGAAVVVASPAIAAAPPPVPPTAAIAQYIEVVPSATGLVPIGGAASRAVTAPLETAVRAKVERTAGADAPALLDLAEDSRFGARPVRRTNPTRGNKQELPGQAVPASIGAPSPLMAAASTAGSGGVLFVALLLAGITAAAIAAKATRR